MARLRQLCITTTLTLAATGYGFAQLPTDQDLRSVLNTSKQVAQAQPPLDQSFNHDSATAPTDNVSRRSVLSNSGSSPVAAPTSPRDADTPPARPVPAAHSGATPSGPQHYGDPIVSARADHLGVSLGKHESNGIRVVGVVLGSPAAAAGVRPGDLIQRVNGQPAQSPAAIAQLSDVQNISVLRNGASQELSLSARASTPPSPPAPLHTGTAGGANNFIPAPAAEPISPPTHNAPTYGDYPPPAPSPAPTYSQPYAGPGHANSPRVLSYRYNRAPVAVHTYSSPANYPYGYGHPWGTPLYGGYPLVPGVLGYGPSPVIYGGGYHHHHNGGRSYYRRSGVGVRFGGVGISF